ncbi:MAG: hypothetical protein ACRDOK_04595 [Streptosporangiaceae bacterium]
MKQLGRRALALLGALAVAGGLTFLATGAASASTTYTAVTSLASRPDSGNNTDNGGNWAVDTLTRTATLVDLGTDPHRPGFDTYSFGLSDTGTFVTDTGLASNPNGLNPLTLIGTDSGTVKGSGTWTEFDVPTGVTPNPAGVPASQDGAGTPSSDWLAYFFNGVSPNLCPGTGLDSVQTDEGTCGQETVFSYLYTDCNGHWLDASTDADGSAVGVTDATDLATIGGISGAACPVVALSPAPTPSGSTTTPPVVTPSGGVATGGTNGPVNSPWLPVGLALLGAGAIGAVTYKVRRSS